MSKSFLLALVGIKTAVLSACGAVYDYDSLRQAEFGGPSFQSELGVQYRALSLIEADLMNDWPDAQKFGVKAMSSGRGGTVPPDDLNSRRLSPATRSELLAARYRLEQALAGNRDRFPIQAARSQAAFDCWVEQAEEGLQPDHIDGCRSRFHSNLAVMRIADPRSGQAADREGAFPAAGAASHVHPPIDQAPIVTVFFAVNDHRLSAAARTALAETVRDLGGPGRHRLLIEGYTDRTGGEAYNLRLSLARAQIVRDALIDNGIRREATRIAAFGEDASRVATSDGASEPLNRRVVVRAFKISESAGLRMETPLNSRKNLSNIPANMPQPTAGSQKYEGIVGRQAVLRGDTGH